MFDHINVIVHHKGKFRRDDHGTLVYVNGEYYVWEGFDKDLMIVWTINDMYKSYGCYQRFNVVYILVLESGLEGGLLWMENDKDVLNMCNIAIIDPEKDGRPCVLWTCGGWYAEDTSWC